MPSSGQLPHSRTYCPSLEPSKPTARKADVSNFAHLQVLRHTQRIEWTVAAPSRKIVQRPWRPRSRDKKIALDSELSKKVRLTAHEDAMALEHLTGKHMGDNQYPQFLHESFRQPFRHRASLSAQSQLPRPGIPRSTSYILVQSLAP